MGVILQVRIVDNDIFTRTQGQALSYGIPLPPIVLIAEYLVVAIGKLILQDFIRDCCGIIN